MRDEETVGLEGLFADGVGGCATHFYFFLGMSGLLTGVGVGVAWMLVIWLVRRGGGGVRGGYLCVSGYCWGSCIMHFVS